MINDPVLFEADELHELIRSKVTSQKLGGLPPPVCIGDDNVSPTEHPEIVSIRKFAYHMALEIATRSGEFDALKAIAVSKLKGAKQREIYWELVQMAKLIEGYLINGKFPMPVAP